MKLKNLIIKLERNPKNIFLIDAGGAFLTCVFLIGILKRFDVYFGMPINTLNLLAIIAFSLFLYSFCCYLLLKKKFKPFLFLVILFNTFYLLISIGMIVRFFNNLTELGLKYFVLELIIIGAVITIEIKSYVVISKINNEQ